MKKEKIDHIIRAAADLVSQKSFVLIGSAAVIARCGNVPLDMMQTSEIDIYAPNAEDVELASELILSNIGNGSEFHNTFGYYGDGVSPVTAKMPSDWGKSRVELSRRWLSKYRGDRP